MSGGRSSSRSRGQHVSLNSLVNLIRQGKAITVITGAGLSAASGIPTFRGTSSSIWAMTSTAKARRATLLRDPVTWYNEVSRMLPTFALL